MLTKEKSKYLSSGKANIGLKFPMISLILLVASGLYFYQLTTESFWIDELYSFHDAQNISKKFPLTRPLYFLILRVWMFFGDSDAWLRGLSIIFALGSIFLIYQLGQRLLGKPVGLVAALLLTLSPVFINHAQEVRMYTLSTFLCLGGTLALAKLLEDNQGSLMTMVTWLVMRLLAALTTPLNVLLLPPDFMLLVWKFRQRKGLLKGLGIVLVVVAVVSLPWIFQVMDSSRDFFGSWVTNEAKPGFTNILSRLTNFTAYWPLKSLTSSFGEHFYKLYTVMLAGIFGFSLVGKPRQSSTVWLVAWTFVPGAIMFAISWLLAPIWLPRYLLFISPYVLILLASGFVKVRRWQPKLALVLALMYFVAVGGGLKDYYTKIYREDWRGASQMINQNQQPDDVIALHMNNERPLPALSRYYTGSAPIYALDLKNWEQDLPEFPSRLWIIHNDNQDSTNTFQNQVKEKFEVQKHQTFQTENGWTVSIDVFLVTPKETNDN